MIKIQIKSIFGSILFEHESENNTVSKTLREANLRGADLYEADLYGADLYEADLYEANLREANLREANLRGANLRGADLRGADLRGADLYGADLYKANLRGADLRGANLRGADLRGADLYGADLYGADFPIFCKWGVSIKLDKIRIGCKSKSVPEWDAFFSSTEVYSTERGTPEFVQIQAVYEAYKAYYLFLNPKTP